MTARSRRRLAAALVCATLVASPGCVHHQLTTRQVAIGAIAAVIVGGLVWLAVTQCDKGAAYCDTSPPPGQ